MIDRAKILAEARRWIGTPYRHQAFLCGHGADCGGLVFGVGNALGLLDLGEAEWSAVANYGRQPHPLRMRAQMTRFLVEIERPRFGDIAWLEWRDGLPMHLAILSLIDGRETIIHAWADAGNVVEHDFSELWRSRVSSWWRYPKVI